MGLIVSGGHSSLYRCRGPLDFEFLGGTIDDAAGEAFDKVAAMLGLPYPGGPSIERAAAGGNPRAYAFPRPLLRDDRLDFSFSGLKTAVRYAIEKGEEEGEGEGGSDQPAVSPPLPVSSPSPLLLADLAASFQEAVVDCLVGKAVAAWTRTGADLVRRRRSGRQQPAPPAARGGGRTAGSSNCTSPRCGSAPTTP